MALHWNITKVKNFQEIAEDEWQSRVTEAIVFASMAYGLGTISGDNVDEWLWRQEFNRHVDDMYPLRRGRERSVFTRAELERRIGLSTNVSNQTRAMFKKLLLEKVEADVQRALTKA